MTRLDVTTARDMLAAVESALPARVFIAVAAVADWRPKQPAELKSEKSAASLTLELVENPDILKTVSSLPSGKRPPLVVGFAAETHDVLTRARAKRDRKGCDWIVANDVSGDAMGGDENEATLIGGGFETSWPRAGKDRIAARLADTIADWHAAAPIT